MSSENLYPVTNGSRCRDLQPSFETRSRSPTEEREGGLYEQVGIKIMTEKATETDDLTLLELMDPGLTASKPAWD